MSHRGNDNGDYTSDTPGGSGLGSLIGAVCDVIFGR